MRQIESNRRSGPDAGHRAGGQYEQGSAERQYQQAYLGWAQIRRMLFPISAGKERPLQS